MSSVSAEWLSNSCGPGADVLSLWCSSSCKESLEFLLFVPSRRRGSSVRRPRVLTLAVCVQSYACSNFVSCALLVQAVRAAV